MKHTNEDVFNITDPHTLHARGVNINIIHVKTDSGVNPWFKAKQVALTLGYVDTVQAVMKNVFKRNIKCKKELIENCDNHNESITAYINLSGLFQLLMKCRLPAAKEFQDWLFDDGLPKLLRAGDFVLSEILGKCQNDIKTGIHKKGFVYMVTSPILTAVKIGRWKSDIESLRNRYATILGQVNIFAVMVDDCYEAETQTLSHFDNHKIISELFELSQMEFIKSYLMALSNNVQEYSK